MPAHASYLDMDYHPSNTYAYGARDNGACVQYELTPRYDAFLGACEPALKDLLVSIDGTYQLESKSREIPRDNAEPVTVKDMVEKIRDVFGLNAVQVAKIVDVSRPSLYNHISGKEAPKDIAIYQSLYDLALTLDREGGTNLKPGLKTVIVDGMTLLEHLKQKPLDASHILSVARQIAIKLSSTEPSPSGLSISDQRAKSRSITKAG